MRFRRGCRLRPSIHRIPSATEGAHTGVTAPVCSDSIVRLLARSIFLLVLASPGLARAGIAFYAGLPDSTFGTDGVVRAPSRPETDEGISGFDLLPNGRILAAGRQEDNAMLVRYLSDGALDPSFGTDGVVLVMPGAGIWSYAGVAIDPNGNAVATGTHRGDFSSEAFVARHDETGAVDAGFGTDGIVPLAPLGVSSVGGQPRIQPDGGILVGGSAAAGPVLVRLDDAGAPDATFGSGGVALLDVGPSPASSTLVDHLLLSDGRIVVLVQSNPGPGAAVLVLARYDAHGSLDATFGTGGVTTLAPASGGGIARQPDGMLVVNGTVPGFDVVPDTIATWRFDADGILDPGFGDGGATTIPFFSPSSGGRVVVQADGKIVITGSDTGFDHFLARYQPDGRLDVTFGSQGIASVFLPGFGLTGFALQSDGKLVGSTEFLFIDVELGRWRMEGDCPSAPRTGCKVARSTIVLREGATDAGDRFEWTWTKGPATDLSEFGNPVESTYYDVCLYDESGTARLIFESGVRAGEICPPYNRTCWQPVRDVGFQYSVPSGDGFLGTTRVLLKAGAAGTTKAIMKARGFQLAYNHLPPPLSAPLRMQFVGSNGLCLEAAYPAASVVRNDAREFKARSDY